MPKVVTTTDEMDAELKAAGSKAVVVDFHATWCGPCKMIAPKLEEFESTYPSVVVLKVDVDDAEELAMRYEVTAMPTFLVIRDGAVVDTVIGADVNKLKEVFIKFSCDTAAAPGGGATPGADATSGADATGETPVIIEETPLIIDGPPFVRRSAKRENESEMLSRVTQSSTLPRQSVGTPVAPVNPPVAPENPPVAPKNPPVAPVNPPVAPVKPKKPAKKKPAKKSEEPVYPKKSVYVRTYVRNPGK